MGHRRDRVRTARFVDSSFWIALQRLKDPHHQEARLLFADQECALVTSNHVVGETWTGINRRSGHLHAVRFLDRVERTDRLEIVRAGEDVERDAHRWLRRHDEREYSFVDATSFALMRHMEILDALAFDGVFSAAGFVELRP
jgi:predicted nucleic acid-binding protein